MSSSAFYPRFMVSLALLSPLLLVLAGCSASFNAPSPAATSSALGAIKGSVYGGQQPIAGSSISLYSASTSGYGAASRLLTAKPVLTDASGGFTLTGQYNCNAGDQVYLYATGGDSSGNNSGFNASIGLLAVLGTCPASGTFASTLPFLSVNEVSTIAAAYAMAPFATDALHVGSSGTALALTGIANAFVNASKIYDVSGASGQSASKTGSVGSGIVPQSLVNGLANILAACINTINGPTCSSLLSTATSDGTATGTIPTDTASAAINIAHHPAANTSKLLSLISSTAPFQPTISGTAITDLSLYVVYILPAYTVDIAIDAPGNVWLGQTYTATSGSTTEYSNAGQILSAAAPYLAYGYNGGVINPYGVAIDLNGDAWVASRQYPAFDDTATNIKYSTTGQVLSGTNGFPVYFYNHAGLTIDASGNVWSADHFYNTVAKMSPAGVLLSPSTPQSGYVTAGFTPAGLNGPVELAADSANNIWLTSTNALIEIGIDGGTESGIGITAGGLSTAGASGLAIDHSNNVWVTGTQNNSIIEVGASSSGIKSPGIGFTDPSLNLPTRIAIDGDGNVWSSQAGGQDISELSSTGAPLSGPYGFTGGGYVGSKGLVYGITNGGGIAVDGAGDVWVAATSGLLNNYVLNDYALYEFIGIAAPVVTPLSAGVANNTLATRP